MGERNPGTLVRFCLPQIITATRVGFGAGALVASVFGRSVLAANLITLGAVTDGLDGPVARKLGVTSDFGAMFDYFADYLCYIVAPVVLSFRLGGGESVDHLTVLLCLPLLAGAVRYSRNVLWLKREAFEEVGFPGLGTVIFAFFIVTLTHLTRAGAIGPVAASWMMTILSPSLSLMMVLPVRYPKLMKHRWIAGPILVGFVVMPFLWTPVLAGITLGLGFVYTVLSPFFMSRKAPARATEC